MSIQGSKTTAFRGSKLEDVLDTCHDWCIGNIIHVGIYEDEGQMIEKALIIIIFMYALNFSMLGIQFMYADVVGHEILMSIHRTS